MADLRKLAEAATPGPWTVHQRNATGIEYNPWVLDAQRDFVAESEPPNAAFIAAANPRAVIGLLDERDRLRAENEGLRAERDSARATERARTERILRALADAYRALHGGGGEYCHALATALDFINQDERSES